MYFMGWYASCELISLMFWKRDNERSVLIALCITTTRTPDCPLTFQGSKRAREWHFE